MLIFILIPMLLILGYSLITTTSSGVIKLTFENIRRCFEPMYLKIIARSFITAICATVLCFIIGYPIAVILSDDTFKRKSTLIFMLLAPMWMNFLLRTYAWLTILEKNGIINRFLSFLRLPNINILYTDAAVMLGMVYNFLPFMILPIYTVISKIDKKLLEASEDLGAGKRQTFMKVIFPLSLPGVLSGTIMVFMPAVTTFVITRLLGGGKTSMIGNVIEQQFLSARNWAFGSALSAILMLFILICVYIANRKGKLEGIV